MSFDELDSMLKPSSRKPDQEGGTDRPIVLVVEDDTRMLESLRILLHERYMLLLCASAEEGVNAMHGEVCAVLLDVMMRGHNGFWACGEIRKHYPDIPIIFYSAYQDVKDPFDIINEYRPFGYIIKDGDSRILSSILETAVRLRKLVLDNNKLIESLKGYREQVIGKS